MAGADILNVGDGDFSKEVLESGQPVLVDFWATWCAPCRAIAPALEELASQYKGKVKVAKLNIDDNQDTPQQYGIRSIPTLLLFKGGKVVEQIVGAVPKAKLEAALQKVV
jgi:thioredoxin 1